MQSAPDLALFVNTTEAAHLLGVNRATVCRWAQNGKLNPSWKVPNGRGDYFFDRDAVIERKVKEELRKAARDA